jgi:hypothetical protein
MDNEYICDSDDSDMYNSDQYDYSDDYDNIMSDNDDYIDWLSKNCDDNVNDSDSD